MTETPDVAPAVVVIRTTIMDGTVLAWFLNLGAAEYGREVISASRNGVDPIAMRSGVPPMVEVMNDCVRKRERSRMACGVRRE